MSDASEMTVLTDVYEKVCDYEELYQSHLSARKGKRYRPDVLKFSDQLEENLIELQNELLWQTYEVGPYRRFYVREPKLRLIMALQYRDRVVQWSIYRQLYPFYDKIFIEDSYACRRNKGTHKAADRLQYWLRQVSRKPGKWYYLKLDISKYFYRVDHEVLLNVLARRVKDPRLMELLGKIVNSEDTKFGLPVGLNPEDCTEDMLLYDVGMPIGNLTSQLFANVYLNELDQFCKHELRIHFYIRFQDDVIILGSKEELMELWAVIEEFLNVQLRLQLNKKTTVRPVAAGVDFIGYRIWPTHRKLKKQTARRIIRNTKRLCGLVQAGQIEQEELWRVLASYNGILLHCNSHGLRSKLQNTLADYGIDEPPKKATQKAATPPPACSGRSCYNCAHYHTSWFCGYESCFCDVYGSLDVDQHERHPDTTGATCPSWEPQPPVC